ncbi:type II toxin-antitoxin system HicB family antitoxin [Lactococcus lactis]|uniref:type II toxin-antitoxin system HicB family antitoxin n=1 Tax=Lactococcus lactis TaxID=1358 RepID=UPI001D17EAF0|nr:type II toxin-antitoxin system HicB family antitoxin [Lactococcus lactis]MCC4119844.1 type II toxin-antitoxin system HicB family antitoxin [Lactococcus lactis]
MTPSLAYQVVISFDENEKSKYKYLAYIPDIEGYTQGESLADAIAMARDYIGTYSLDNELPVPSKLKVDSDPGDIVTLVDINPETYKKAINRKPVKKTLTIPSYLNDAAVEEGLNFSQTLADAIKEKLALS